MNSYNPSGMLPDAAMEPGDMFLPPRAIPTPDIDAEPLLCVAFNEEWAGVLALALQRMIYHDAWAGTDAEIQRACEQIDHLIGQLLMGGCP